MKKIYFIAMDEEIKGIFDLTTFDHQKEYGFSVYKSDDAIIIKTGVGKTNAAAAAQFALQSYPDSSYINTGLVGAFNTSLKVGQVIQVDKCRFFDVDVTAFNFALGQIFQCDLVDYTLNNENNSKDLFSAYLITGDTFINNPSLRESVITNFNPDVIDMELASIAHVFHLHNKLDQLTSIKAVCDDAGQSSHIDFYALMAQALASLKEYFGKVE